MAGWARLGLTPMQPAKKRKTKHMKIENQNPKLKILVVLMSALAIHGHAQTNTSALPQTFFQSAQNYFTSVNTNYTWAGNTLEVAAGADYMSSVNWASYLDAQYNFGGASVPTSRLAIEAKIRNAGIAGTVVSAQLGLQYTLISYYSVKLQAGVAGGYDLDRNTPLIEPKLTLRGKLTPNTFAGIVLSLPVWTNGRSLNNVPDIGLEAGFTY